MKAAALAKRTLAEKTAEHAAIVNPAEDVTTAWEAAAEQEGSKLNLEGKAEDEEAAIAAKWNAYKAWIDAHYTTWSQGFVNDFEERWAAADTAGGYSEPYWNLVEKRD